MPENDTPSSELEAAETAAPQTVTAADFAPLDQTQKGQPWWVWAGMGALVLAALFVVFVLPGIVEDYELPLERRVDTLSASTPETSRAATTDTGVSPFLEAQRSRDRKAAQDVLAELLEKQSALDTLGAADWAETDYSAAVDAATRGDEFYRTQEFALAQESYQQGLAALSAIESSLPAVLEQRLIAGEQALTARDRASALAAFELAAEIEVALIDEEAMVPVPSPSRAEIGLGRAEVLAELNELIEQAERSREAGEQVELLERAVALDPYSDEADSLLTQARARLLEQRFAAAMSQGYERLQAGAPDAAIERFEAAAALGIKTDEALAAIDQTATELINAEINALLTAAQAAERNEQWDSAVAEYEAIVALDPNLPAVNAALDYAGKRAQLDALLIAALDAPERFAEPAVFEETRDVYFTGRAIEEPAPRLVSQLDTLQGLLESSQIPVSIRFISDGLTDVSLLRIGELGTFEATRVDLKPGRYAAVGRREGFREVREEFTVGFGLTPAVVIVRCDEPISAALGR